MNIKKLKNTSLIDTCIVDDLLNYLQSYGATTLALPTGNTPLVFYKILTSKQIDWTKIKIFMLDAWYPQDPKDSLSFYSYIRQGLLNNINLPSKNFHILNSNAKNPEEECQKYEEEMRKAGGIDLVILGIGENGHIGFNEPGTSPDSLTHLAQLAPETLLANGNVPGINQGLTMGIKTIMSAKKIFLLAKGKTKAKAVKDAVEGKVSTDCPASFLQNHPDCTFFLDLDAASLLRMSS